MQTIKCCCYWGITGEPWEVRQKSSHSSRVVKYSQVCLSKKKKDKKDGRWVTVDCVSQRQQQKCATHLSFCNMLKKKLACGSFNSSFLQKTFQWSGVVVERLLFIWFFFLEEEEEWGGWEVAQDRWEALTTSPSHQNLTGMVSMATVLWGHKVSYERAEGRRPAWEWTQSKLGCLTGITTNPRCDGHEW